MRMQKSQLDTPIGFNLKCIAQCTMHIAMCTVFSTLPLYPKCPCINELKGNKIRWLKKGWIHGHGEIMDLDFENYKNVNKCIC